MNRTNLQSRVHRARAALFNVGRKAAAGVGIAVAGIGSAMATTPADTKTTVLAEVSKVQADGIAIAGAVTLMIFMIAGAKWLRRAK